MTQCPKCKKEIPVIVDKNMLILYSLYLAFGSVAFFIFINSIYTTGQAIIWRYSWKYILNSGIIAFASLFSGVLFFLTCYWMLRLKKIAKISGIFSCLVFIFYPLVVVIFGTTVPYSFTYILILCFPVAVLLILSLWFWKKSS